MAYRENKKKYNQEYTRTHLKRVPLDVQITEFETIKKHADSKGEPVNTFIKRSIREQIKRDNDPDILPFDTAPEFDKK
jgi:predicted DNA binding CopG/RHH family protein